MLKRIKNFIMKFIEVESGSSIILGISTLLALFIANSNMAAAYQDFLNYKLYFLSVSHWVNDGLMAIFFFLVGLEIKKEVIDGELNSIKKASLPIAAAVGGMIIPAVIYLLFNTTPPENSGWGIPMATDIAFALGVLSVFGKRIPSSLKILLLAVAIVDDLGAILVIAIFYTTQLKWLGLAIGIFAVLVIQLLKYFRISNYFYFIPIGVVLWFGILYSGVHATIAGVILGLMTPIRFRTNEAKQIHPVEGLIKFLHTPVSYIIMPIFALANAGVVISFDSFLESVRTDMFKGIFLGLVLGKPIGILLFSYIGCQLRLALLPRDLKWKHILVLGIIAGIGFTMSLFISKLAVISEYEQTAKLAVLAATLVAMLIGTGSVFLLLLPKHSK